MNEMDYFLQAIWKFLLPVSDILEPGPEQVPGWIQIMEATVVTTR